MLNGIPDEAQPIFRIGDVAELLGVHTRTLRLYEQRGLVLPERRRGQRRYSQNDIRWLRCLRQLVHEQGYNLDAIARLMDFAPCWELRGCAAEVRETCSAAQPRRLRCWHITERVCEREDVPCRSCEVYLAEQGEPPGEPGK